MSGCISYLKVVIVARVGRICWYPVPSTKEAYHHNTDVVHTNTLTDIAKRNGNTRRRKWELSPPNGRGSSLYIYIVYIYKYINIKLVVLTTTL